MEISISESKYASKVSFLRKSFFLSLVFLFIFGPIFFGARWLDTSFFVSIAFALYYLSFNSFQLPKIFISFFGILLIYSFLALYAAIFSDASTAELFYLQFRPIRIIITLVGGFGLIFFLAKNIGQDINNFILNAIFISIVLHGIIMIIQFVSPATKDLIYSWTTSGIFRSSFGYNFRMGGLSGGSGGSVLSVVQALGVIIFPLVIRQAQSFKSIYIVGLMICLTSVIMSGRSGVLAIVLFTPLIVFLLGIKIRTFIKAFIIFLLISIILFFLAVRTGLIDNFEFMKTFDTATDFIYFLSIGGITNIPTVAYLLSTLTLPNDMSLIIGDPSIILNSQYNRSLESDIGYVRNIWAMGLIGTIVYIFPLLNILFSEIRNFKDSISCFLLISLFVMLFFHLKEPFLYVRMFFPIIALLIALRSLNTIGLNNK